MSNEKGFIKFYNVFMENSEHKLTPREWYFYSLLAARWNPFLDVCETTVSRIAEIQHVYRDKNEPSNDKGKVLRDLFRLQEKGLIKITYDGELYSKNNKADYNKVLSIFFNEFDGKFEKIHKKIYDLATEIYEYYFLCVLVRFKNGFEKSYDGLATLLDCNKKTVENTVKSLADKNLIKIVSGTKLKMDDGTFSTTPNKYYLNLGIEEKYESENNTIKVLEEDLNTDKLSPDYIKTLINKSNWGKKIIENGKERNAKLLNDDVYLVCYCEENDLEKSFVTKSKNTIEYLRNNGWLNPDIDTWLDNYAINKDEWITGHYNKVNMSRINEGNVNAVVMEEGKVIVINKMNIDQINFDEVAKLYFKNDSGTLSTGDIRKLSTIEDKIDPEEHDKAIEIYKEIVRIGKVIDIGDIKMIRESVK